MAQPLNNVTLRLKGITTGTADPEALARIRADLGIPAGLEFCEVDLVGRLYGPQWSDYAVKVIGVPYRVEGWTPDFAPSWPYMALDDLPGPAAFVIQIWGIRSDSRHLPGRRRADLATGTRRRLPHPISANLAEMTQDAWAIARRGLDLLTRAEQHHGRPPNTYPVPDAVIVQAYRDMRANKGASPTQEQLVAFLDDCGHQIALRTLQTRCKQHGGWRIWPASAV